MNKPHVRKIRDDDPDYIRNLAAVGMAWLVFRHDDEAPGRAFTNFRNAVHWAVEDRRRWA